MVLNNFFYNSKPDACAFIFFIDVESLEYFKYLVFILRIEADTVVSNGNMTIIFLWRKPPGPNGRVFILEMNAFCNFAFLRFPGLLVSI